MVAMAKKTMTESLQFDISFLNCWHCIARLHLQTHTSDFIDPALWLFPPKHQPFQNPQMLFHTQVIWNDPALWCFSETSTIPKPTDVISKQNKCHLQVTGISQDCSVPVNTLPEKVQGPCGDQGKQVQQVVKGNAYKPDQTEVNLVIVQIWSKCPVQWS